LAQIFSRNSNTLSRLGIALVVLSVLGGLTLIALIYRSPYISNQGIPPEQPIPFSHKHHVQQLGIDCRFCHTSVENSSFAGIPSAKTCMTCHSQMWTNAEVLKPLRDAYQADRPIPWVRVHHLPEFVYFNHSVHIAKGVACTTCHGPVDHMEMIEKHSTLWMSWCLDCHRHPEKFVGAKASVFKSDWLTPRIHDLDRHIELAKAELPSTEMPTSPEEIRKALVKHRKIPNNRTMSECYTCHR
jgi:hypothetical protein